MTESAFKKYRGTKRIEIIEAPPKPGLAFLTGLKIVPTTFLTCQGKTLYRVSKTKIIRTLSRLKRFAHVELVKAMMVKDEFLTFIKDISCCISCAASSSSHRRRPVTA